MLRVRANAKINWMLNITGVRPDGYHEMDMLMQSVSLCDNMTFENSDDLSLSINGMPPQWDENNLICRAAELLKRECGCPMGAAMTLEKRIPARAGLGGGSADGAAALRALNTLWNLRLSEGDLLHLGLSLGADFPFCLTGGLQRVRGIGERLSRLNAPASPEILLVMPDEGLSTGAVFRAFDAQARFETAEADRAQSALLTGDYAALRKYAVNHLASPAGAISPAVNRAVEDLYAAGASFAVMSGSGSCVFGVFDRVQAAQTTLEARYERVFHVKTCAQGVEFL